MNYYDLKRLKSFLSGEAMDAAPAAAGVNVPAVAACNCGKDHGSEEKNVAPSVVEGDEKAEDCGNGVSSEVEDKSVGNTEYGEMTIPYAPAEDANLNVGKLALKPGGWQNPRAGRLSASIYKAAAKSPTGKVHSDGTPCMAQSEKTCRKNGGHIQVGAGEAGGSEIPASGDGADVIGGKESSGGADAKVKAYVQEHWDDLEGDDFDEKKVSAMIAAPDLTRADFERDDGDFSADDYEMHGAMNWYLDQDGAGNREDFGKEWRAFKRHYKATNGSKGFKRWYEDEYSGGNERPMANAPVASSRGQRPQSMKDDIVRYHGRARGSSGSGRSMGFATAFGGML